MVKAKAVGAGIGAFFNNPGVIILGALAVLLLFFRGDIRNAFGSLGQGITEGIGGLGDINIQLPEFNFPDIKFPDITFPSFDFGGLFGGVQFPQFPNLPPGGIEGIPLDPEGVNPPGAPTAPTPIDIILGEGGTVTNPILPDDPNQDPNRFLPPIPEEGDPGFIGPTQPFLLPPTPIAPTPEPVEQPLSALNIGQEQPFAEAPLGALSLSAIIEQFDVTASQAANIKFIAQEGGDPFAAPGNIFGENPPSISDPQFEGFSLEAIAAAIGQPISNF